VGKEATGNHVGHWWLTSVILATQEAKSGGSQFEASLYKMKGRLYLKNTKHKKGLLEWLKR
jgi:hypothetical protein